jgi:hypothetical protein
MSVPAEPNVYTQFGLGTVVATALAATVIELRLNIFMKNVGWL